MQHPTPATASYDADLDPLAKVRNPDGTVNWLAVGEAEQARRARCATPEMTTVLDWLHANGGTFYVVKAAERFHRHAVAANRRYVRHNPPMVTIRRTAPRPRGAGRPRAQATRSSARSGDSPGDSDPHEPDAAPLRLAPRRAVLTFGGLSAAERGEETS